MIKLDLKTMTLAAFAALGSSVACLGVKMYQLDRSCQKLKADNLSLQVQLNNVKRSRFYSGQDAYFFGDLNGDGKVDAFLILPYGGAPALNYEPSLIVPRDADSQRSESF